MHHLESVIFSPISVDRNGKTSIIGTRATAISVIPSEHNTFSVAKRPDVDLVSREGKLGNKLQNMLLVFGKLIKSKVANSSFT